MIRAMLRRDFRLFLRGLIPALLLTAFLVLLCAGAAFSAGKGAANLFVPFRAAVVDEENSLLSRILVNAVKEMDYIAPLMELEQMEPEQAKQALTRGELAAVIVLPADFTSHIVEGQEYRGQIFLSAAAASNGEIVRAAARCGELLLAAGQYGVFSGESLLRIHGITGAPYDEFLARSNLALLEEAAGASSRYFDTVVTDYASSGLPTAACYGVGWLTLLLFLCSMFFGDLCRRDLNRPVLCRLRAAGVRDCAFLSGKLIFPVLFRWILLIPLLTFLLPAMNRSPGAGDALSALAGAAAAGIMGSALMLCLSSGSAVSAILSLAGLFLCGGIIPARMLPGILLKLGDLTPFGAVRSLLAPTLGAAHSLWGWVLTSLYTEAALLWMGHRLKRLRVGGDCP